MSETPSVASRPTENELDLELADLVNWQRFATHLPDLTREDIEEIKLNNPQNVAQQKLNLFGTWLRKSSDASWNDVISALEKAQEKRLADTIRKKFKIDDVLVVCRPLVHQQDEYLSTLETFGTDVPNWYILPETQSPHLLPPCTVMMFNYKEHKRVNDQWCSLPFYTTTDGYKLQLRVHANGFGIDKGKNVSVSIYLMKGENDETLKWPIRSEIWIQFLNWREDKRHVERTIDHYNAPIEYRRRVVDGETAPGSIICQFISHMELYYNADNNTEYLHKDALCFCVSKVITYIHTDERDKELFIEECKKGEIKIHPVKCILSGLPRVGKTSFMSRLQGKKPLDDSPSTGIERPVSITILERTNFAATIINQKGKWVLTDNVLEEGCLLLQHVKQLKTSSSGEATTDISKDSSDDFDKSTVKDSLDHFNKPLETASSFKPSGDRKTKETKQRVHESFLPIHKFLSQVSSAQQILENLKESVTVYFMDTGGQPEFHELLPPILHGPALHLIFFNASLDLNKPVQINYCHKEEIESFKYTSNSSSIEILHQLLSSFYFLQEKSNSVLLGSHIDMLDIDESQHHVMINKISDVLKQHMEETDYYKNAFLTFPTDSNNIFLPIDNKTASEEELEQIKKFLEIVFNRFEAVPLPITWAAFHLILRYKYEKSGVCTITDCEDLAEECGIKRENVVSVLRFLHNNVGTILYYEEVDSLNELVICDPNILFHGLSHLVTVSFAGSGVNYTIADTIRKTGVIPQYVLDKAKSQDPSSPLNAQHLINLLKHYKLIKEIKQDGDISYFMPCLLQLENLTSSLSADVVKDLDTPPLVIMFYSIGCFLISGN